MRKALIAASVAGATLFALAQTRPSISQIRGPVVPDAKLLALVNGRLATVSFGPGVQLVQSGSSFELQAVLPSPAEAKLTRAADGTWTLPAGCPAPVIYRNGLRQLRGLDFSISGIALRFVDAAGDPSEPDDVVIAECH
jgi:hypothetical protein